MKKLRRITEDEVLSEFLKAEFYHREFNSDRLQFEACVNAPNLLDENENAIRRALLFRKRGNMWRELPGDTQWWEIELEPQDLERVQVFPRAHWRGISDGNFRALYVAEQVRQRLNSAPPGAIPNKDAFLSKVQLLLSQLQAPGPRSTVMLIGVDETLPMTLLEGNHRFVSSLLLPREIMMRRLRLVCGFSANMEKCCWYKTDLANLFHYLRNRIKHLWAREADMDRLRPHAADAGDAGGYARQGLK